MKQVVCQMCQNKTTEPQKVMFFGWNNELNFPCQINLCPRCHSVWRKDNEQT